MFAEIDSAYDDTPTVDLKRITTKLREINPDMDKNLKVRKSSVVKGEISLLFKITVDVKFTPPTIQKYNKAIIQVVSNKKYVTFGAQIFNPSAEQQAFVADPYS